MAKIINHTTCELPLPTGHVVPRRGTLDTSDEVIRHVDNAPILQGFIANGQFSVEFDLAPEAAPEIKGKKPITASA